MPLRAEALPCLQQLRWWGWPRLHGRTRWEGQAMVV